MSHIQANPAVVQDLVARMPLDSPATLAATVETLASQLRLTTQHTQTYQTPTDQMFPATLPLTELAKYTHPFNIAAAMLSLAFAAPQVGADPIVFAPDLQVYLGTWEPLSRCTADIVQTTIILPAPVAPPPPPPAPVPPAPAFGAPPPPPPGQLVEPPPSQATAAAIDALLAGGQPTPPTVTTPTIPVAPEAPPAAPQAPSAPVPTAPAPVAHAPLPPATPQPPAAPTAPVAGNETGVLGDLPDSSIRTERTGQSGRPQKSPFEKKIEAKQKMAPAPAWWRSFEVAFRNILIKHPAAAVDDSSSGVTPVQAYALAMNVLLQSLKGVNPHTTVAELRSFLREVDTQITHLEGAEAIYQLSEHLLSKHQ